MSSARHPSAHVPRCLSSSRYRLCPVQLTSVEADLHLDEVDTNLQTGDFLNPSLAKQIDTPEVRALVLKTYLHKAQTRRSTLIFCTNLTHVENLKMTFREAGVDARSVSSEQPPKERQRLIQEFGAGKYPVLINCEVLTEGTDIPQVRPLHPSLRKNVLSHRSTVSSSLDRRRVETSSSRW